MGGFVSFSSCILKRAWIVVYRDDEEEDENKKK